MSYGFFCERDQKPSEEQIVKLLGNKSKQWDAINSYLVNTIKAKSLYKFYGKNYGWALGYSKSGKRVSCLYPLSNDFTIQIILKKNNEAEIIKTINNKELLDLIKNKPETREGKWIFIKYSRIKSTTLIKKMIDIKLK